MTIVTHVPNKSISINVDIFLVIRECHLDFLLNAGTNVFYPLISHKITTFQSLLIGKISHFYYVTHVITLISIMTNGYDIYDKQEQLFAIGDMNEQQTKQS